MLNTHWIEPPIWPTSTQGTAQARVGAWEKRIEPYFVEFLDRRLVPFWVRNHVRQVLSNKELLDRESKRLMIGTITYYGPLLAFFVLLMWYLMKG